MIKKISGILLAVGAIISTGTMAADNKPIPKMSITYTFLPNVPKVISNLWPFTPDITAVCSIAMTDPEATVDTTLTKGEGTVKVSHNGQTVTNIVLAKDVSQKIKIEPNDTLIIESRSNASVTLTNLGNHEIVATCSNQ